MPQRASVFCNFYIRVDRETLVSERALDVGSIAFKAMSTKSMFGKKYFKNRLKNFQYNIFGALYPQILQTFTLLTSEKIENIISSLVVRQYYFLTSDSIAIFAH
jgi:hypothetical protein